MSSKVVKGGVPDAEPILWRVAGTPFKPPQKVITPLFVPSPTATQAPAGNGAGADSSAETAARIQALESRIQALQREMEQRGQASFQQGQQQGLLQGESNARQQLSGQVDAAVQRLARSIEEMSGYRQRYRREAEADLVRLALAISRRILHRELTIDPDALVGLIRVSLDKLDGQELHRVRVHPEYASAVRQYLDSMGLPRKVEVIADPSLERGGALLESSRGVLDASAEIQLAEIERGLADLVRHAP